MSKIPELECAHEDGRPRTRLEMDQWVREKIPQVHWLRIIGAKHYGLQKPLAWGMTEIMLRHWILDELVRRGQISGDLVGVNQNAHEDDGEIRQFTQRLVAAIAAGQAVQPHSQEGVDMSGFTPPPPPTMGGAPSNGQPVGAPQGFAPPPSPPGYAPQPQPPGPPGPGYGPPPGPPGATQQFQGPPGGYAPPPGPGPQPQPGYGPPPGPPAGPGPQGFGPPGPGTPPPPPQQAAPAPAAGGRGGRGRGKAAEQQAAPPPPAAPVPGGFPAPSAPQGFAPAGNFQPGPPQPQPGLPPQGAGGFAPPPPAGGFAPQAQQPPQQQVAQAPVASVDLGPVLQSVSSLTALVQQLQQQNAALERRVAMSNHAVCIIIRAIYQDPNTAGGSPDLERFLAEKFGIQNPQ